jgi:hypothetical protein
MTTAAFSLLNHAADNRERWLSRFYEIGKEAVRPRKKGELSAFLVPSRSFDDVRQPECAQLFLSDEYRKDRVLWILEKGGVEIDLVAQLEIDGKTRGSYDKPTAVVRLDQPYGSFAKAMLENQTYPDLRDASGQPIAPYDVTSHTLPLLQDVQYETFSAALPDYKIRSKGIDEPPSGICPPIKPKHTYIYRSNVPSMDEGWTRWVFENYRREYPGTFTTLSNSEITRLSPLGSTVLFPDQPPNQILNGYAKGSIPDEYTGGVGKEGVENLRKFVEAGGTLVFLNRSSDFAIREFKLPVKNVTAGLPRKDFYIPGSILRTELDTTHPIAKGMPQQSIAWFEESPAFEIQTDPLALTNNFKIIARYPSDPKQILLSGWALGAEKIAGKAALVEFTVGKGKIVLSGFRPQYRGQRIATFPLLVNAISQ